MVYNKIHLIYDVCRSNEYRWKIYVIRKVLWRSLDFKKCMCIMTHRLIWLQPLPETRTLVLIIMIIIIFHHQQVPTVLKLLFYMFYCCLLTAHLLFKQWKECVICFIDKEKAVIELFPWDAVLTSSSILSRFEDINWG